MIKEGKFGCITQWGDYVPYYDEEGRFIESVPVNEVKEWSRLSKREQEFFELYYGEPS
jgi:hypothetical protein